jgi:hypothetical protein
MPCINPADFEDTYAIYEVDKFITYRDGSIKKADLVKSTKTSEAETVNHWFQSILGRPADIIGLNYYVGELSKHTETELYNKFTQDAKAELGRDGVNRIYTYCEYTDPNTIQTSSVLVDNILCISVIDESSPSAETTRQDWLDFRAAYPNRRFVLLQPDSGYSTDRLNIPAEYDGTVFSGLREDIGNPALREDWFEIASVFSVPTGGTVSFALDTSGSLNKKVKASYDYFVQRCADAGLILDDKIMLPQERWVVPHNKIFNLQNPTEDEKPEPVEPRTPILDPANVVDKPITASELNTKLLSRPASARLTMTDLYNRAFIRPNFTDNTYQIVTTPSSPDTASLNYGFFEGLHKYAIPYPDPVVNITRQPEIYGEVDANSGNKAFSIQYTVDWLESEWPSFRERGTNDVVERSIIVIMYKRIDNGLWSEEVRRNVTLRSDDTYTNAENISTAFAATSIDDRKNTEIKFHVIPKLRIVETIDSTGLVLPEEIYTTTEISNNGSMTIKPYDIGNTKPVLDMQTIQELYDTAIVYVRSIDDTVAISRDQEYYFSGNQTGYQIVPFTAPGRNPQISVDWEWQFKSQTNLSFDWGSLNRLDIPADGDFPENTNKKLRIAPLNSNWQGHQFRLTATPTATLQNPAQVISGDFQTSPNFQVLFVNYQLKDPEYVLPADNTVTVARGFIDSVDFYTRWTGETPTTYYWRIENVTNGSVASTSVWNTVSGSFSNTENLLAPPSDPGFNKNEIPLDSKSGTGSDNYRLSVYKNSNFTGLAARTVFRLQYFTPVIELESAEVFVGGGSRTQQRTHTLQFNANTLSAETGTLNLGLPSDAVSAKVTKFELRGDFSTDSEYLDLTPYGRPFGGGNTDRYSTGQDGRAWITLAWNGGDLIKDPSTNQWLIEYLHPINVNYVISGMPTGVYAEARFTLDVELAAEGVAGGNVYDKNGIQNLSVTEQDSIVYTGRARYYGAGETVRWKYDVKSDPNDSGDVINEIDGFVPGQYYSVTTQLRPGSTNTADTVFELPELLTVDDSDQGGTAGNREQLDIVIADSGLNTKDLVKLNINDKQEEFFTFTSAPRSASFSYILVNNSTQYVYSTGGGSIGWSSRPYILKSPSGTRSVVSEKWQYSNGSAWYDLTEYYGSTSTTVFGTSYRSTRTFGSYSVNWSDWASGSGTYSYRYIVEVYDSATNTTQSYASSIATLQITRDSEYYSNGIVAANLLKVYEENEGPIQIWVRSWNARGRTVKYSLSNNDLRATPIVGFWPGATSTVVRQGSVNIPSGGPILRDDYFTLPSINDNTTIKHGHSRFNAYPYWTPEPGEAGFEGENGIFSIEGLGSFKSNYYVVNQRGFNVNDFSKGTVDVFVTGITLDTDGTDPIYITEGATGLPTISVSAHNVPPDDQISNWVVGFLGDVADHWKDTLPLQDANFNALYGLPLPDLVFSNSASTAQEQWDGTYRASVTFPALTPLPDISGDLSGKIVICYKGYADPGKINTINRIVWERPLTVRNTIPAPWVENLDQLLVVANTYQANEGDTVTIYIKDKATSTNPKYDSWNDATPIPPGTQLYAKVSGGLGFTIDDFDIDPAYESGVQYALLTVRPDGNAGPVRVTLDENDGLEDNETFELRVAFSQADLTSDYASSGSITVKDTEPPPYTVTWESDAPSRITSIKPSDSSGATTLKAQLHIAPNGTWAAKVGVDAVLQNAGFGRWMEQDSVFDPADFTVSDYTFGQGNLGVNGSFGGPSYGADLTATRVWSLELNVDADVKAGQASITKVIEITGPGGEIFSSFVTFECSVETR